MARVPKGRTAPQIAGLFAAALLIPALLFALAAWNDYRQIMRLAEESVQRTTATLHEHAAKVFETNEIVFARVEDRLHGLAWDAIARDEESHHRFLRQIADRLPQVSNILAIDPGGQPRVQALVFPSPAHLNLADRDYFTEHKGDRDGTFVGRVVKGRSTGSQVFGMSRERQARNGAFDGVLYIGMLPSYFVEFWHSFTTAPDHMALLLRADGEVLARYPSLGEEPVKLPADNPLMVATRGAATGVFHAPSRLDDTSRVVAFKRLEKYPVYVAYGYGHPTILQAWWRNLSLYGLAALLAALALVIVIHFATRSMASEQAALTRLLAETERRERAETSLVHAQKMEMLGQLTGGIAHDFGNIVQIMSGTLGALKGRQADERLEKRVELALSAMDKATRLTHQLLAFARKQPLSPRVMSPNAALQEMLPLLAQALGGRIGLEVRLAAEVWPVAVDAAQLELALLNLVVNARHAMPDGGAVTLTTANRVVEDGADGSLRGEFVAITVADTGSGMAPDVLARAFEPFFTTKEEGKGTGLGLAMVYGFAKQSGGHAEVTSEPGRGTAVTLLFPRTSAAASEDRDKHVAPDNVVRLSR